MSAMADMSRAMRHVLEDHSIDRTLKTVPTDDLTQFVTIIEALYLDMKDELETRVVAA